MRHRTMITLAALLMVCPRGSAQPMRSGFSLTIYSSADPALFDPQDYAETPIGNRGGPLPGYAVVRETRKIDLQAGINSLRFNDVAAGIDPTTVTFKSLTAPDSTMVLEQNYEYDLVSPDKLLAKYVGKEIIINRKQEPLKDDKTHAPETIQGTLLTYDVNEYVLQTENKRLPVQIIPRNADLSEIKLFELQTGLITKPTLVWRVQAEKAGEHDAQVTYQTNQITWRADYTLVVNKDDTAAEFGAWVTVVNQSGAAYPESQLKLVAGDVRRLRGNDETYARKDNNGMFAGRAAKAPEFTEKPFFEYHLYSLGRPTSFANNSTKQIELFPRKSNVPLEKKYVYVGDPRAIGYEIPGGPNQDRSFGQRGNTKVDVHVRVNNSGKNGLGIPLPAGRVRVYKRDDTDGLEEFIGEDVIPHTPKDESVTLRLGSAFDVVAERKQTGFDENMDQKWITESFEIKLRNHKKEPVEVVIKEDMLRWTRWEISKSSDKFEKQDARTIHIPVSVPPDGEKVVTYTVKYTWE